MSERLADDDVVCIEAYGDKYVAIIWRDPERGPIANLRTGSGRHHTLINPDVDEILEDESVIDTNVVSVEDANAR